MTGIETPCFVLVAVALGLSCRCSRHDDDEEGRGHMGVWHAGTC